MAWPPDANVCPHCGYIYPRIPVWPPPVGIAGPYPPAPLASKLVTGKVWGDVTLGLSLSFLSNFLFCVGFVAMPIMYFTLKPNYPSFARGLGLGFLLGLVVLVVGVIASVAVMLGALANCKKAL